MTAIPFPINSSPGNRPAEGAGRLINCFAQKNEPGARSQFRWQRSPGLSLVNDSVPEPHCRALLQVGNVSSGPVLFAIFDNACYVADIDIENLFLAGTIDAADPVTIAANNRSPTPDVVCVLFGTGAFVLTYNPPLPPTPYPDSDLPTNVNSVSAHNGYFVFTCADGQIVISELNSTDINSLSNNLAAGELTRGISFGDVWLAFGATFFEIYRDIGASPFPFELVARVPRGLAGRFAIAGHEKGGPGRVLWVADNDTVVELNGSALPTVVSTDDVSRDISASNRETLEAFVYSSDSNHFWVLTNPGVEGWTWEYNLTTGAWNERRSDGRNDWRVSQTARAFDKWICGDRETGILGEITTQAKDEYGVNTTAQIESGVVPAFPANYGIPRVDFDITTHVGSSADPDDTDIFDPEVSISWSDNGGRTYGNAVTRKLGNETADRPRVTVLRTGLMRDHSGRRFKLTIDDPVHFTLFGGDMEAQPRGKNG